MSQHERMWNIEILSKEASKFNFKTNLKTFRLVLFWTWQWAELVLVVGRVGMWAELTGFHLKVSSFTPASDKDLYNFDPNTWMINKRSIKWKLTLLITHTNTKAKIKENFNLKCFYIWAYCCWWYLVYGRHCKFILHTFVRIGLSNYLWHRLHPSNSCYKQSPRWNID